MMACLASGCCVDSLTVSVRSEDGVLLGLMCATHAAGAVADGAAVQVSAREVTMIEGAGAPGVDDPYWDASDELEAAGGPCDCAECMGEALQNAIGRARGER